MQRRTFIPAAAFAAVSCFIGLPAAAQGTWPTGKTISYVVPLPQAAPPIRWAA